MDYDSLKLKLEGLEISDDKIEELLITLKSEEQKKENEEARKNKEIELLRDQIDKEDDWKKRSSLVAKIISMSL